MQKKSYFYEIPVYYLFVFLLGNWNQASPIQFQIHLYLYWVGIILFAYRYGTYSGLISGLFSAGLYLASFWWRWDRFRFEDWDFYILPAFYILVGLCLGSGCHQLREILRQKNKDIEDLKERMSKFMDEIIIQKQMIQNFEKGTVTQMASMATIYQGAKQLGNLDQTALFKGIGEFFAQALKATKTSIYVKNESGWTVHQKMGWHKDQEFPEKLGFYEGLIGKAGSENRVVSLREWFGTDLEKAWAGRKRADSLMAGPLRSTSKGVIAVFSIQDMPFLKFNSASLNLFTLLLDWAQEAIDKCFYFEELKSKSISDDVYNVYNTQYFNQRFHQEFQRSKVYSLPLSLLLVKVEGIASYPLPTQVNFYRALSQAILGCANEMDIVTKYSEADYPFAVTMITAPRTKTLELKSKIEKSCEKLGLLNGKGKNISVRLGVGSFHPRMNTAEEIIDEAKNSLQ